MNEDSAKVSPNPPHTSPSQDANQDSSELNFDFIERYQKIYAQNPESRIFAPLAEAYRKMKLYKEAREVAESGVKTHPDFPGGHVALAKIELDEKNYDKALKQLEKVTQLSPENILAHSLMGETYLRLKEPKQALRAYKKLLFLSPDNEKALNAVKKLEGLTADEYDDDFFAMKPLKEAIKDWDELEMEDNKPTSEVKSQKVKARLLSLADAHLVRNDTERAIEALSEAERLFGAEPEIVKRLKIIHQKNLDTLSYPKKSPELEPIPTLDERDIEDKIRNLRFLLKKVQTKKTL